MADRSGAEMAGRVIEYLDSVGAAPELIRGVWTIVSDADFDPSQAEIDSLREKYGLDWEANDAD